MPASVTVEGGGSGLYLDCFSDAYRGLQSYCSITIYEHLLQPVLPCLQ